MHDSLSSALTDHSRGLQTKWTTSIKGEKIVETKSQQMIVFGIDGYLTIGTLKVEFIQKATLA